MFPLAELATWLERFRQCREAVLRVATELASEGGGPLTSSVQRANDPEVWRGAIADQFSGVIGSLERALDPVIDHLEWLLKELSAAEREADAALRTQAAGLAVPAGFDPVALATRLRVVPPPDPPSFFGWQAPLARYSGFVGLSPDAARGLAAELRRTADEVRRLPGVLQEPFASLRLEVPSTFHVVAHETDAVAEEIIRRVRIFESADAEVASRFQALDLTAASLATALEPLDPDDAFGSAVRRVLPTGPPPVAAMPGPQPTQAKEADPVSTSTGNYFLQVVDLAQPARGLPTVFARTYNSSRAGVDGPLGVGWSHSFGALLTVDESGATVEWADGRQERHRRSEARFIAPAGAHDVLHETSVGYEMATKAKIDYRFDGDGRLLAISDPSGNATVLLRDDAGALTAVLDASGIETVLERDPVGRITAVVGVLDRRWTYAYDPEGLLVSVTDPEGGQTTYGYDGSRRLTTMFDPEWRLVVRNRYDDAGRVVEQTDGAGATWRYAYEPGLTVVTDPFGHSRGFGFDEQYRTDGVVDAMGAVTRFSWDDRSNLTSVLDPTGRLFAFSWDDRGNLRSASGPGTPPVTFEWDDADNLTAVVSGAGERATVSWDDHARPIEQCSAAGVRTVVTWRDDGAPDTVTDGLSASTRYGYDAAGRPEWFTDALGATTRVAFDAAGRPCWERHPDGGEMSFEWDRADRLVSVTDAAEGLVRFGYDRSGRLVTVGDAAGRVTRYSYDGRGFLSSVVDALGRETSFEYDLCGRLAVRTDARSKPVSFSYDPAGRLVAIEASDITPITYRWDEAGRLIGMSDETGDTTWELDAAGRPSAELRADGTVVAHRYDEMGRRRRVELRRDGGVLAAWDYDADADGRITAVATSLTQMIGLRYDPLGQLKQVGYPNGVTTTWSYDAVGQPLVLKTSGSDGSALQTFRAEYDSDGNRLRCQRMDGPYGIATATVYGYDALGRLTSATTEQRTVTYTWDPSHNRTSSGPAGSAVFDAADQIVSDGRYTYEHDPAGYLVTRRPRAGDGHIRSCRHDALGRVVAIRADGEEVCFAYDGLGRRSRRIADSGVLERAFDGMSVLAEIDSSGLVSLETSAGLLVLARNDGSGLRFLHPGLSMEVAAVTDETGQVVGHAGYGPFGEQVASDGLASVGPLGFGGALGAREELGGLLDMRARFYDPLLGRFISPDPWPASQPEPVTLNRYLYALGDPVSQVDPYGLWCWTGKSHGKCRGLKDVAQRLSEPLGTLSTVATGAAAIMAGVTMLCPLPCGPITGTAAAVFQGVALGTRVVASATGAAATLSQCVGSGLVSFKCMSSAASTAVASALGFGMRVGSLPLGLSSDVQRFGGYTFGLFLGAAGEASARMK